MKKIFKLFFIIIILFLYKNGIASNSSSYLISKSAFSNYDFATVLYEFSGNNNTILDENYLDKLIASIITSDMITAKKISEKILFNYPDNQESKLVIIINHLLNNQEEKIDRYRFDNDNSTNELIEYIFFNNDQIKNKIQISKSLIEIVKNTYVNQSNIIETNYNFLLFYSSLAILINPENYEAHFIKAQLFQIINKYTEAESSFLNIDKSSEYYIDAQRNIAFNYRKIHNFQTSEIKINQIIEKNNNNYELKKILADFYRIEKKYKKAINEYDELIKYNKEDIWYIYYLRGICYERLNFWNLAEEDFLQSLVIKEDSPDVLNYLAYGWIEKNMHIEKAFTMLSKAYSANPNSYYILDSLAWAYYKKNNLPKAAELMEKVIDMVPGEAISLDHLGDIYFAMNRKREAIYFWQQAKDLAEPEDEIINNIIDKINKYNAG